MKLAALLAQIQFLRKSSVCAWKVSLSVCCASRTLAGQKTLSQSNAYLHHQEGQQGQGQGQRMGAQQGQWHQRSSTTSSCRVAMPWDNPKPG